MRAPKSYRDRGQLFGTDGASSWIEPDLFAGISQAGDPEPLNPCNDHQLSID